MQSFCATTKIFVPGLVFICHAQVWKHIFAFFRGRRSMSLRIECFAPFSLPHQNFGPHFKTFSIQAYALRRCSDSSMTEPETWNAFFWHKASEARACCASVFHTGNIFAIWYITTLWHYNGITVPLFLTNKNIKFFSTDALKLNHPFRCSMYSCCSQVPSTFSEVWGSLSVSSTTAP